VSSTGKINASGTSNYVGIGQTPVAYLARALTSSTIKVVFSEPMDTASATDPNNYAVSGLTIYGVAAESPTEYVVSTSTMVPNTDYVLEVTGVIDRANNPV
jgi:ABC-type uncharacterized transport system substrate-binding protein